MSNQHLPPLHAPRRTRAFCFATFRFAGTPRFELVYLTASLSRHRRRWLRLGAPGKVSATLLGLDDDPVAIKNVTATPDQKKPIQNLRGGLRTTLPPIRTAAERPRYQREMELRHDTYGGTFADWPDPGGAEQPV